MSSLFMPQCGVPTFRQTDSNVISHCAKINGYVVAIILAIAIMAIAVSESFKKWREDEKKGIKRDYKYIIIAAIVSLLIVLFLPLVIAYFSINSWKTTQMQINQCVKQGRSRKQCVDQQQKWEETTMKANATRQSGHEIAAAIAGSRR